MSENQEQKNIGIQNSEINHPKYDGKEKENLSPEKFVELSPRDIESRAEKARDDALEKAISVESGGKEKQPSTSTQSRRSTINKKQREKSYKQTMSHVQKELPVSSRLFSKFIHNDIVEKTSDIVGSTIARPNAILAGSIASFILTLLMYTTAKTIGYSLSGFETIATFIVGWLIGIILDYFRVLITGKKI